MHQTDQGSQTSGCEREGRCRQQRPAIGGLGAAGWDELPAAAIGPLDDQVRFPAAPLATHDGDQLPGQRVMRRRDADAFDVTGINLLSLLAGVPSATSAKA